MFSRSIYSFSLLPPQSYVLWLFDFPVVCCGYSSPSPTVTWEEWRHLTLPQPVPYPPAAICYPLWYRLRTAREEEHKSKTTDVEMSWITEGTNWEFTRVPDNLVAEAKEWARAQIEAEEMGSDGEDM